MNNKAVELAKLFHETYMRLAPKFDYKIRDEFAVQWDELPESNRNLMIAVSTELLSLLRQAGQAEAGEFTKAARMFIPPKEVFDSIPITDISEQPGQIERLLHQACDLIDSLTAELQAAQEALQEIIKTATDSPLDLSPLEIRLKKIAEQALSKGTKDGNEQKTIS